MATIALSEASTPLRPARGAWRAAVVLMVAMTLSYVDRTLPMVLIEPIRGEMGLTDTQLALLTGLSFAACYALMVAPFSWAADRFSRPLVITIGVVTWSVMTVLSGLVHGFWPLFFCRMGVGLGEAALVPAAYALLADLFPSRLAPRGLAVMTLGIPLGIAAAFAAGGIIHDFFETTALTAELGLSAWRMTFIVVGVASLLLAPFTATMPEPRGSRVVRSRAAAAEAGSFKAFVVRTAGFVLCFAGALTLINMAVAGSLSWAAPFFTRAHGWSVGQAGSAIGAVALGAGLVGAPFAAVTVDLVTRRLKKDGIVLFLAAFVAFSIPFAAIGPFAPSPWISLACIGVLLLMATGVSAVAPAAMVNTAPPLLRARASAIYVVCVGLVGTGLGPVSYGLFTDYIVGDPSGLPISLSVVASALLVGAGALLLIANRTYETALRRAAEVPA
jgi:MFS family permease